VAEALIGLSSVMIHFFCAIITLFFPDASTRDCLVVVGVVVEVVQIKVDVVGILYFHTSLIILLLNLVNLINECEKELCWFWSY